MSEPVFDVAVPNEDGTDLVIVGQIEGKQNLIDFIGSIRPDRLEDLDE
jgi:hypothetical protein